MTSSCPGCASEAPKGARFCRSCGAELDVRAGMAKAPGKQAPPPTLPGLAPPGPTLDLGDARPTSRRKVGIWILAGALFAVAASVVVLAIVLAQGAGSDRSDRADGAQPRASSASSTSTSSTTSSTTTTVITTPPTPIASLEALVDELLDAETAHDWAKVRAMYPFHASTPDSQLDTGYAATREQMAVLRGVPVQVGVTSWRTTWLHIAHDDNGSGPTTGVFCQHWVVDVGARVITVEQQGTKLASFGGWLAPEQLPADVSSRC